ncbi:hypothetical protein C0Q70_11016 [Pomacea canaliculata]|uniref:Uncharacterized protein n=1 Tax=Pomacea canaliculata TaxID=400727 RepID=A0A2T7P4T4_POMCA|nr:hypothetical protein C0Q70_11016 [Pomacea canaliculata]
MSHKPFAEPPDGATRQQVQRVHDTVRILRCAGYDTFCHPRPPPIHPPASGLLTPMSLCGCGHQCTPYLSVHSFVEEIKYESVCRGALEEEEEEEEKVRETPSYHDPPTLH